MKRSAVEQLLRPLPSKSKAHQPVSPGDAASGKTSRVARLDDLQYMIVDLIAPYLTMSTDQVDSEIRGSIRRIVELLGVDRGYLTQYSATEKRMICTHYYESATSTPAVCSREISIPAWGLQKIQNRECVTFSRVADLPEEAKQAIAYFKGMGTQSHISFPLVLDGEVVGCLSLECTRSVIDSPESIVPKLMLMVDVLAMAIGRKRKKLELIERIRFETLFSNISARLVNVNPVEVDKEIGRAFEMIGRFFGVDRCGLLEYHPEEKSVKVTHAWYDEGIERVPDGMDLKLLFPWSFERLFVHGECVSVASLADLAPEADKDRETWTAMGVRSSLSIPLYVGKNIRHVIAFNKLNSERSWQEEYIPRLRLIGDVFINALMRKESDMKLRKSLVDIRSLKDKLQSEAEFLRMEIRSSQDMEEIVGQSTALLKVMTQVKQVAPTDSTVLICGETGTGKELIAQAIHEMSLHRDKLMVKVNCASLPATLVESELFGREKGAYTGALTRQIGRFELADGSTIFLDEIAELPLELQAKLLRVLQEGTFERLGSPKTIRVHVRVVAATNRNILEEVKKGAFREDLYYRLNVFPITVPPLRERTEDIPMLVWTFVNEFCEKMGKKVHQIAKRDMEALQHYSWPGNVRELRNVIEHAVIISSGGALQLRLPHDSTVQENFRAMTLEDVECEHILDVLHRTGGRIKGEGGVAQILGMIPSTLYSRIKKLGIKLHNEKGEISS